jgi:glutamyl-tRNA reductase
VVADDLGLGQEEADKVWLLVTEKARQFNGWLRSLDAVPTIVALREQAEQIRQEELQHMSPKLALLTDEERRAVDILTSSIVNRLLHQPTVELKKGDNGMSMEERLRAVRMLFNLSASRPR